MKSLMKRPAETNRWLDPLFEDFFSAPSLFSRWDSDFTPRVDIVETKDHLMMTFEVPGMEKNDIKVQIKDNVLSISGDRESRTEDSHENYIRREIRSGSFCRQFTLPRTVDTNTINAEYKNGILEVRLDKLEEAKPKEIEIKVS
jgi:HSP20 family protein